MTLSTATGARRRHASATAASVTSVNAPTSSGRRSSCSIAATMVPTTTSTEAATAIPISSLDGTPVPRRRRGGGPQRHRAVVVGGAAHGTDATATSDRLLATVVVAFAGQLASVVADCILSSHEISGSLKLDHPVELLTTY